MSNESQVFLASHPQAAFLRQRGYKWIMFQKPHSITSALTLFATCTFDILSYACVGCVCMCVCEQTQEKP